MSARVRRIQHYPIGAIVLATAVLVGPATATPDLSQDPPVRTSMVVSANWLRDHGTASHWSIAVCSSAVSSSYRLRVVVGVLVMLSSVQVPDTIVK